METLTYIKVGVDAITLKMHRPVRGFYIPYFYCSRRIRYLKATKALIT